MSKRTLLAILTVVCIFSQSEAAQPPAATKFRIFDSQKQAGEFFRKLPEAQQFAGENGKVNLIPFADARYKRAEKIVAATFQSYKKHYPALVSGIENPPYVLLLESDEVNAFVISDKNPADPIPYLFVVHTEGEKKWKDEGEFAGIIAH